MTFKRFAIYYAPPAGADWTRWATAWLGWDMEAGCAIAHPDIAGLPAPVDQITRTPRKYGLHGTIKPPFRLAEGTSLGDLEVAMERLCASLAPVRLQGLTLTRLGRFLALCPPQDPAFGALAARCVRELDRFRAPASEAELAKRRSSALSKTQEANFVQWGYPYVMDDFRFHITLSGKLPKAELPPVIAALEAQLCPLLPTPLVMHDLALVGEDEDGQFHLIHRYTLSG
ncbi:DUF1045 domain-containing protein [Falsiphaeobacter marinintestinus]|uniref:DUF1045 domain-containing protein n=1 Tax=Falsiphaeobacter marinintestinus TaxID=1492905 RepID=UPI0011B7623E|nr:DUF1045 domain-containing protein [Phaeobacter marinintestinus]